MSLDRKILEKIVATSKRFAPSLNPFRTFGIASGVSHYQQSPHKTALPYRSAVTTPPKTVEAELHPLYQRYLAHVSDPKPEKLSFVLELRNGFTTWDGASLTDEGALIEEVAHEFRWGNIGDHKLFGLRSLKPFPKIANFKGSVASFSARSSDNYYHWIWDVLPRFHLLDHLGYRPDKIYIDDKTSFQKEALALLGYHPEQIISIRTHPIISAVSMLVPAFPAFRVSVSKWVGNYLRNTFWDKVSDSPTPLPKRLYLSREDAKWRKVVNEAEVMKLCHENGFEKIQLSQLSFSDQVRLFRNAQAIISPHSAGLANLAFCREGTKVIELFPAIFLREAYWVQSQVMGLDYYYLMGKGKETMPRQDSPYGDIWVDIDKLSRTLKLINS